MGEGFPSGPWLPWRGRGGSPSEVGSISLFLRSQILPLHHFFYIRRSVTPIGMNLSPDFSHKIRFLAAKEERQLPYGMPRRVQGTPPVWWPPRALSRVDSSSQKSQIFQNNSPSVFIPFGLHLILGFCETKNMQQTGTGTGHDDPQV